MSLKNDRNKVGFYCAASFGAGLLASYALSYIRQKRENKSVSESTKLWKENPALYNYIMRRGNREITELRQIHEVTNEKFGEAYGDWITSQDQCYLFAWLCKLLRARKAIEVGVFTGSSALTIAKSLKSIGSDAELVAIDHHSGQRFVDVAAQSFEDAKLNDVVSLRLKGGIVELDALCNSKSQLGSFDFAYVDAVKTEYCDYYDRLKALVKPGGVMAFDNTLLCGRVANLDQLDDLEPEHKARVEYMARFNDKVRNDEEVEMCMIAIGDGLTLVTKKQ